MSFTPGDPRWLAIVDAMANVMLEHGQEPNVLQSIDAPHPGFRLPLADAESWSWSVRPADLTADSGDVARSVYAKYRAFLKAAAGQVVHVSRPPDFSAAYVQLDRTSLGRHGRE
jgi:hypothetical protein